MSNLSKANLDVPNTKYWREKALLNGNKLCCISLANKRVKNDCTDNGLYRI